MCFGSTMESGKVRGAIESKEETPRSWCHRGLEHENFDYGANLFGLVLTNEMQSNCGWPESMAVTGLAADYNLASFSNAPSHAIGLIYALADFASGRAVLVSQAF